MSQSLTSADHALPGDDETFRRSTFFTLGAGGMAIGLLTPALAYLFLRGFVPDIAGAGERLAFALPWMGFPLLALAAGLLAVGSGRVASDAIDGSPPTTGTRLELHRRYMQNTVEQLALFIPTQLALATLLPPDRLALIPAWSLLFLVARVTFWLGYLSNPALRSLGMSMHHANLLALVYVLTRAVT